MAAPIARAANKMMAGVLWKFLTVPDKHCQLCAVTRQSYIYRYYLSASYHTSLANRQRKRKRKQRKVKEQQELPTIMSEEGEQALNEFKNPKSCLHNVLSLVSKSGKPPYEYSLQPGSSLVKESILRVTWPQEFTVVGLGRKRTHAERMAAALACSKLKELGVLDNDNKPRLSGKVLHNREDIMESLKKENQPDWVILEPELEKEIKQVLQEVKEQRASSCMESTKRFKASDENFESLFIDDEPVNEDQLSDVINGRPYREITEDREQWKNKYLASRQQSLEEMLCEDLQRTSLRADAMNLPIADRRQEILHLIDNNQTIVLTGETGCGKTTQVPQYLLEDWIRQSKGAQCNIVVTQPRRISAVSVAERVAHERREPVGDTIGYQVRLNSKLPHNNGCILFCTTGILLKKLESNPTLIGISHVIVDEVHERDINTDFLLILLKHVLRENPSIKLVLMSASINAELISSYFNNCPMISVPGFMYPVQEYYLPKICQLLGRRDREFDRKQSSADDDDCYRRPLTDLDLAVDVIEYIERERPSGAILCFLPGWQDIKTVCNRLEDLWPNSPHHLVLPVHSSVPLSAQQSIFERPGEGVRKIVLATNIAETSITINDVVYVVNPGNHKEDRYDIKLGVSCLDVQWISKANVRQRKGRAGRCQPGECYHLFTEKRYHQLEDYQVPEILRIPLEQTVVQSKSHFRDMSAASLLSQAMQPPPLSAVEKAVEVLRDLAILNEDESLTALGDKIVGISAEPRLAKAIVLSAVFGCVRPILTVAAGMHTRAPFMDSMERRAEILKIRKSFAADSGSDHLAQVRLFDSWDQAMHAYEVRSFNYDNRVHHSTMLFIRGLRQQLADNLEEVGLVSSAKDCVRGYDGSNENASDDELVKSVLCMAFFPNILRVRRGKLEKSRLKLKHLVFKDMEYNKVLLSRRSVNCTVKEFSSRWLTYFSKAMSDQIFIHDTSILHPLALLCMSGRQIDMIPLSRKDLQSQQMEGTDPDSEVVKLVISTGDHWTGSTRTSRVPVAFYTTYGTARTLRALVREVNAMVEECLQAESLDQLPQDVRNRHEDILEVLQKVINSPQVPFMKTRKEKDDEEDIYNLDATSDVDLKLPQAKKVQAGHVLSLLRVQ